MVTFDHVQALHPVEKRASTYTCTRTVQLTDSFCRSIAAKHHTVEDIVTCHMRLGKTKTCAADPYASRSWIKGL